MAEPQMETDAAKRFEEVVRRDGRYPLEAFEFLQGGLELTARTVHGEGEGSGPRHVSGQQLCEGLRGLALRRWGPLAKLVLQRWNVNATRDFGEMVFLLVNAGLMGKQDSDCVDDFDDVYDFDEAFDSYEIRLDGQD